MGRLVEVEDTIPVPFGRPRTGAGDLAAKLRAGSPCFLTMREKQTASETAYGTITATVMPRCAKCQIEAGGCGAKHETAVRAARLSF